MVDEYTYYKNKAIDLLKAIYGAGNNKFENAYHNELDTVINSVITMEQIKLLKEVLGKETKVSVDNTELISVLKEQNKELIKEIKTLKEIPTTKKTSKK